MILSGLGMSELVKVRHGSMWGGVTRTPGLPGQKDYWTSEFSEKHCHVTKLNSSVETGRGNYPLWMMGFHATVCVCARTYAHACVAHVYTYTHTHTSSSCTCTHTMTYYGFLKIFPFRLITSLSLYVVVICSDEQLSLHGLLSNRARVALLITGQGFQWWTESHTGSEQLLFPAVCTREIMGGESAEGFFRVPLNLLHGSWEYSNYHLFLSLTPQKAGGCPPSQQKKKGHKLLM